MTTRQRKHQLERRADGLCGVEGCKEKSGARYYCTEHARAHRANVRKRRAGVKAAHA